MLHRTHLGAPCLGSHATSKWEIARVPHLEIFDALGSLIRAISSLVEGAFVIIFMELPSIY